MEPNKLPEGRKPLPDEWFAERAQMQERINGLEERLEAATNDAKEAEAYAGELEAKLAIYEAALKHIAQHDTQMRAIKALSEAKGDEDE